MLNIYKKLLKKEFLIYISIKIFFFLCQVKVRYNKIEYILRLLLLLLVFIFCFGVRNKNGYVLSKKVSPKLQRNQNKEEMKRTSPVLYVYIIQTDICLRALLEIEWTCHYLEKMIRQNKIKGRKRVVFLEECDKEKKMEEIRDVVEVLSGRQRVHVCLQGH